jgi:hypothetical protein
MKQEGERKKADEGRREVMDDDLWSRLDSSSSCLGTKKRYCTAAC